MCNEKKIKEYVDLYAEFSAEVDKKIPKMGDSDRLSLFAIALKDMRSHRHIEHEHKATLSELINRLINLADSDIAGTWTPTERQRKMLYAKLIAFSKNTGEEIDINGIIRKVRDKEIFDLLIDRLKEEGY